MDTVENSTRTGIQNTAKQWFRDANKRLLSYRKKIAKLDKEPSMSGDESEQEHPEKEKSRKKAKKVTKPQNLVEIQP